MFSDTFFTLFHDFLGGVTEKRVSLLPLPGGGGHPTVQSYIHCRGSHLIKTSIIIHNHNTAVLTHYAIITIH